jgi:hypothetical protein
MKCYNHTDIDAVGICKNCNKGVCISCAIDVGNGIACSETCANEVKQINVLIERNKNAYQKIADGYLRNTSMYLGLAIIFILIWNFDGRQEFFLIVFGVACLLIGILTYMRGRRLNKTKPQ